MYSVQLLVRCLIILDQENHNWIALHELEVNQRTAVNIACPDTFILFWCSILTYSNYSKQLNLILLLMTCRTYVKNAIPMGCTPLLKLNGLKISVYIEAHTQNASCLLCFSCVNSFDGRSFCVGEPHLSLWFQSAVFAIWHGKLPCQYLLTRNAKNYEVYLMLIVTWLMHFLSLHLEK
jgi:hypothetical protein